MGTEHAPGEKVSPRHYIGAIVTEDNVDNINDIWQKKLDNWFEYHAPKAGQGESYERIRASGKAFAEVLVQLCPDSADRTAAIRKIREAVYSANAAIACEGK